MSSIAPAPRRTLAGALVLAALAGTLVSLAGAPFELSFPAFLGPAALHAAIVVAPRRALWIGLVAGTISNAINTYWVVGLLQTFAGFPLIAALPVGALLWIAQSLPFVAASVWAAGCLRAGARIWPLPVALVVAASWMPAIFPWRLGLSQLPWIEYAQIAELGGAPLLDLSVALAGVAALEALRRREVSASTRVVSRSSAKAFLIASACIALPTTYGALRLPSVRAERDGARALAVGVVQPNVGIFDKHDPTQHFDHLRLLLAMTRDLEARGAELVLWPESSYPYPWYRGDDHDRAGALALRGEGVRGPILLGVISTGGASGIAAAHDREGRMVGAFRMGEGARYNSSLAVERDGRVVGIADKVRLLAFGEYVPFWDYLPPLQERFRRGLTEGRGYQRVEIAGARVGVLNCYEDILPDYVLDQARAQPELWANLTNNAWFGDTTAPHLHHFAARLRAIETRRDLVRAVNTGVSGHVLATGENGVVTRTFVRDVFIARARLMRGTTPWVWLGDWVTPLCAGALIGGALALRRRWS
ncbi:MAG: apolipoprotein N-acyltransferase [Sandaracinaceae bacterium]|nr:apolipoprotein N-acyltransferase [Sandaracinaceae bacterium]